MGENRIAVMTGEELPPLSKGETVFLLCGRIDHDGLSLDPDNDDQPVLDPRSFSWLSAEVRGRESFDSYEIVFPDGSVTEYERRFLLTRTEATRFAEVGLVELKSVEARERTAR